MAAPADLSGPAGANRDERDGDPDQMAQDIETRRAIRQAIAPPNMGIVGMGATASTRFYFSDWLSDPGVRASSFAARGLWFDMLCIAGVNKGKEHGFVLIAGRVASAADLARHLGGTLDEVETLLSELEKNRVYTVDRRGAIYCRRMVKSEKNRRNGRLATSDKTLKNLRNQNPLDGSVEPLNYSATDLPLPNGSVAPPRLKARPSRVRGRSVLPPNWQLSERGRAYAAEHGFDGRRAEQMAERFKNHHQSRGTLIADVEATWRTWVLNQVKFDARDGVAAMGATSARGGFASLVVNDLLKGA